MALTKYYFDLMSQPSRAVYIFLKINNIPFEPKPVAIRKGEHFGEEYTKVNPFQRVPVIDDDGFILTESIAIVNYLSRKHNLPDHWYPQNDIKKRARVEEYAHWQHFNIRTNAAMTFQHMIILPLMKQREIDWSKVNRYIEETKKSIGHMDNYFLRQNQYLCGDEISIADIFGVCELMQLSMIKEENLFESNPTVKSWLERVKARLNPHFEEAHSVVKMARPKMLERLGRL